MGELLGLFLKLCVDEESLTYLVYCLLTSISIILFGHKFRVFLTNFLV